MSLAAVGLPFVSGMFGRTATYDVVVAGTSERWWLVLVVTIAAVLRFSFLFPGVWQQPWTPHHFDEHFLPYEALALWEGVTPREVGWPASTSRLVLSTVYATRMLVEVGPELARQPDAAAVMALVAQWSGHRVADPAPLYQLARLTSATIGVIQVIVMILAARHWVGPRAAILAGALTAVAPTAVTHSSLVLADVTGVLFATLALGGLPGAVRNVSCAAVLGLLVGLATASKFHFGIWLLPAVALYWVAPGARADGGRRLQASVALLVAFAVTMVALVPWLLINPVLAAKEFAGVVLTKAGAGSTGIGGILKNLSTSMSGLGWCTLLAAVPGCRALWRRTDGLGTLLVVFTAALIGLCGMATIVFDRYGLLVLPALALAGAAACDRALASSPSRMAIALTMVLGIGAFQSVIAIERTGSLNTYHVAHDWMLAQLPDKASVVVFSEDNQYLPRSRAQLVECAAGVWSDSSYREKWATNGVAIGTGSGTPMKLAILNDELFHAFWCSRELLATPPRTFVVHRFYPGLRFRTLASDAMEAEFTKGLTEPSRGFDAVLTHLPFTGRQPDLTFKTDVGPTLRLYLRPGVALRGGSSDGGHDER
jgi:hypothetical protein